METVNHIHIILTKMFEMVDDTFVPGIEKEYNWFWKHSWTQAQEDEFVEWLTNYLLNSSEARNLLMRWPPKNKKKCQAVAKEFVWNYGWKTIKNNENETNN